MSDTARVLNATEQPLVVDDEGRIVGGGEWADLDTAAPRVAAHLLAGRLIAPILGEAASGTPTAPRAVTGTDTATAE